MIKILISGPLNFGPIGRHLISFFNTLINNKNYKIFIDNYWFDNFGPDPKENESLKQLFEKYNTSISYNHNHNDYDFLIYTGVLSHGLSDIQIERINAIKAKIKICYPVFDGTVPPLEWIDIINEHFDICTSPSNYVAFNLKRYGVNIPCFGLHCAILNDELLKKIPNVINEKIRFGFIGAAEQRKNPLKVVEAFHKNFNNNHNIELFIHCSYSFENDYLNELIKIIDKYSKTSNIIFSYGENKSHEEMIKIFSSFSCYIYPQKTSGYFTTPAEALSLGIPAIISDIGVHQELAQHTKLKEEDGLFLIPCNIAEPICHKSLDSRYVGAQYDCKVTDIADAMLKFYDNKEEIFKNTSIQKRKNAGSLYSAENLTQIYNNLISPQEICLSKSSNQLNQNSFCMNSQKLLNKYLEIYPSLRINNEQFKLIEYNFKIANEKTTKIIENYSIKKQIKYFKKFYKNKLLKITNKFSKKSLLDIRNLFKMN